MKSYFSEQTSIQELCPASPSFTAIPCPFFCPYLFFRLSAWERWWYVLLCWLYKMSEHETENTLDLTIFWGIRLRTKGLKNLTVFGLAFLAFLYLLLR